MFREPLESRYLLVTLIPYFVDEDGSVWLDRLWHRDFVRHPEYIRHLTLLAPRLPKPSDDPDLLRVEVPPGRTVEFVALPELGSVRQAIVELPATLRASWSAVSSAEIVHSSVVGWPYPIGWVVNTFALLRKKTLLINIESATWRMSGSSDDNWRRAIRASVTEALARFFVNRASVSFFSHPGYRDSLLTGGAGPGYITPASWIDDSDVIATEKAAEIWRAKVSERPVRLLFAGRLTADKGVEVLLEAVGTPGLDGVRIDIIGTGPLRSACEQLAASHPDRVRMLDPVPYGAPFFELVQRYHALLVPSVSDEQPRIVFDSYAQAVPVIASDTEGLRPNVTHGEIGWLVPKGDARALAEAIRRAAERPAELEAAGMRALAFVRGRTHDALHGARYRILSERFDKRAGKGTPLPGVGSVLGR